MTGSTQDPIVLLRKLRAMCIKFDLDSVLDKWAPRDAEAASDLQTCRVIDDYLKEHAS